MANENSGLSEHSNEQKGGGRNKEALLKAGINGLAMRLHRDSYRVFSHRVFPL